MSKLKNMSLSPRELEIRDQAIEWERKKIIEGSRALAQAIISTKKLFGPMTVDQQIEAVKYAYDIEPVIRSRA